MSSDNVSPAGSFLAIKGKPIFADLVRKMETHCPDAWLLDFAKTNKRWGSRRARR